VTGEKERRREGLQGRKRSTPTRRWKRKKCQGKFDDRRSIAVNKFKKTQKDTGPKMDGKRKETIAAPR
jgi:hypothetical protein